MIKKCLYFKIILAILFVLPVRFLEAQEAGSPRRALVKVLGTSDTTVPLLPESEKVFTPIGFRGSGFVTPEPTPLQRLTNSYEALHRELQSMQPGVPRTLTAGVTVKLLPQTPEELSFKALKAGEIRRKISFPTTESIISALTLLLQDPTLPHELSGLLTQFAQIDHQQCLPDELKKAILTSIGIWEKYRWGYYSQ